jgi:hypothetical protein
MITKRSGWITVLGVVVLFGTGSPSSSQEKPLIFPIPRQVQLVGGKYSLDSSTVILVPSRGRKDEEFLARLLQHDLNDRFGLSARILSQLPSGATDKVILIGTITTPLVKKACESQRLLSVLKDLGGEGYVLAVSEKAVVVAGNSASGVLYGVESLRQLIRRDGASLSIPRLIVVDSPRYPFRGIKLYVPGKENIPFFKRFIADFVALYKFNKIILELNANMRLDRHPELNRGAVEFADHLKYSRLGRPPGPHKEYQNSSHQDNADGGILEKEDVAEIVATMRQFHIEVIPELPSLTHSYYLLAGHKDLAENKNQEYPDTYCPLKPEIYKLYFDVLEEYIDVIHPGMVHIGHDEWRMEKDICDLCRGKDYNELYARDLSTIYGFLKKKGVQVAIWGDHLLESVYGKEFQVWKTSTGYQYKIPASLRPDQVEKLVPKDILVFNWFWNDVENDRQLSRFGFRQVYGNLRPDISEWDARETIPGVLGGAPSSWAGTTERNFGKDQLYDFLSGANLLWSPRYVRPDTLACMIEPLVATIGAAFRGTVLPSEKGCKVAALDLSAFRNSALNSGIDSIDATHLVSGAARKGDARYEISSPSANGLRALVVRTHDPQNASQPLQSIPVNEDVSSILFLQSCAKEAVNRKAYDAIYNFDETAELLGWYEMVYEDGFVQTVPIRYGVNILDWRWQQRLMQNEKDKVKYSQNRYAYAAAAVDCSSDPQHPVTFFSFEWENARYGKKIHHINLRSVAPTKGNDNAILLLAVSISHAARGTEAQGQEAQ